MNKRMMFCIAVLALAFVCVPTFASEADVASSEADIPSYVASLCNGKQMTLRTPDASDQIAFNAQGDRTSKMKDGPWYENVRFTCTAATFENPKIVFAGARLIHIYDSKQEQFVDLKSKQKILVAVEAPPFATLERVQELLDKIFLKDGESMAEVAPEFWKRFLRPEMVEGPQGKKRNFAPIPKPEDSADVPGSDSRGRFGYSVSPPHLLRDRDPEYTKWGKEKKIQGVCVLAATIGIDGVPREFQIIRPLGYGLDEKAVEAVQTWRFEPARKDGVPVPLRVNFEVNFRLF